MSPTSSQCLSSDPATSPRNSRLIMRDNHNHARGIMDMLRPEGSLGCLGSNSEALKKRSKIRTKNRLRSPPPPPLPLRHAAGGIFKRNFDRFFNRFFKAIELGPWARWRSVFSTSPLNLSWPHSRSRCSWRGREDDLIGVVSVASGMNLE